MRDLPWYGYVFIALIIFGLFYFIHYKPKNDELKSVREERIQTEKEVAMLKQKKEELDQIEQELRLLNVQLKNLEAIIPQEEEIDVILRRIQQLAFDSRIDIVRFNPKALIDREFFSEKPISMELTGNYHNIALFFSKLSNFARLFTIEDFSIKALRNQTDASTIRTNSTAKTYVFHEETETEEKSEEEK
ncbi:MAG: type 4a pilus biogenesis protein PilO [Candidatus Aminicenantes bacterium]|nr:type 4a pilus biogenesis protein PilO [Candidatus Aminicenantes bacterium]